MPFITRPGGHAASYPGPYTATEVGMRVHVLEAQFGPLYATLSRYLNDVTPASTHYLPLGNRIMACLATMGNVVGDDPALGYMREIDCAFFIPAVRLENLVPQEIVFFAPYLFIDVPQALTTGREVHGYRKDLGTSFHAALPAGQNPTPADISHIDAWAVAAAGDLLSPQRVVTISAGGEGGEAWGSQAEVIAEILGALVGSLESLLTPLANSLGLTPTQLKDAVLAVLTNLMTTFVGSADLRMPLVFLRQFRDPQDSREADVQQVLTADIRVPLASLSGHKLAPGHTVTFHDQASHPFGAEFGITSGSPIPSSLSFESSCSFTLGHAR